MVSRGSMVSLKGHPQKSGVVLQVLAGPGSFATWVEVLWNDNSVTTHDIHNLSPCRENNN